MRTAGPSDDLDREPVLGGKDDAAVVQRMGRKRRHDEQPCRRFHDRSAGGKAVGRRTGRGRDDQAVGAVTGQEAAVQVDIQVNDLAGVAAADDDLV